MIWNLIIQRYTDIRSDERKPVSILFLHSLLLGFSTSLFFVAANSYFIKNVKINNIPYAYIAAGILGILLVFLFKYLIKVIGSIFTFFTVLVLFAITCFALYIGHLYLDSTSLLSLVLAFLGFIFIFPFSGLFVLGFTGICLQLFNLHQNKRLLALIGVGEVVASIIGYLMVPIITKFTGNTVHLFLFSGIFILASTRPIWHIYKINIKTFSVTPGSKTIKRNYVGIFKKDRFYRSLAIVTFFSVLAVYFSDYAYLISVRKLAQLTSMDVANIVAVLFCIIKIGELLFSFFSAKIISTIGMKFSLLLLPFMLILFSTLSILAFSMFKEVLIFVILFFLMSKWCDRVLRKGVYAPSSKVMYQVVEPVERMQLQTTIEGTISQFSIVLSGLILLLVSKLKLTTNNDVLFYSLTAISALFSICWFVMAWLLFNNYKTKIHDYLHNINGIKNTVQKQNTSILINQWVNNTEFGLSIEDKNSILQVYDNVQMDTVNMQKIMEHIAFYNPSLQSFLANNDSTLLHKKIVRLYFTNDHFFSRVLIIKYLQQNNQLSDFNIFYELYEAADFEIKKIIISSLNQLNYTTQNNQYYFYDLCKIFVQEIVWAELSIYDTINVPNHHLHTLLHEYATECKNHLLNILKVLYGNNVITIVQQVLNENDKAAEGSIFAVELLDNILQQPLKEKIIPVFEPIPQQMRWAKLGTFCNIYHLSEEQRLKEILIKNFNLINIKLKQTALESYYNLTQNKEVLKAFSTSNLEEMKATAEILNNKENPNPYFSKEEFLNKLQLNSIVNQYQLQYLCRFAIGLENENKLNNNFIAVNKTTALEYILKVKANNNQKILLDIIGLSVLFRLQQE